MNIIISVSLAIWDIPFGWHFACYVLAGCIGGVSGLCLSSVPLSPSFLALI